MLRPGVFISHNWNDKSFVLRLAADLERHGVRTWTDEAEIKVGDSLIEKIRAGIDAMDFVAVVLSVTSVQSEWVKREVDIAMNQEIEGKRVKVLPLLLSQCDLPGFLKGKKYADFTSPAKYADAFRQLLLAVGVFPRTHSAIEEQSFLTLAAQRLQGAATVASRLLAYAQKNDEYASRATLEVVYHEFARMREHRALEQIKQLRGIPSGMAFIQRSFAVLEALCLVAREDLGSVKRRLTNTPSRQDLTYLEQASIALQDGIVSLALDNAAEADRAWKESWSFRQTASDTEYPLFRLQRVFDRSVVDALLGAQPVTEVVKELPFKSLRGAAHLSAVNARVIRKSRPVLRAIEKYAAVRSWKHVNSYEQMQRRLREYEVFLFSNSGTLYPAVVDKPTR